MRSIEMQTGRGLPGRRALLQIAIGLGVAFWILDAVISALVFDSGTILGQLMTPAAERIWLRLLVLAVMAGFGYSAHRVISRARSVPGIPPNTDELSQSIFENSQDGFAVLDTDLNIIHANPWIENAYSAFQPLAGKKCYEVFQQRRTACTQCPCVKVLQDGKPHVGVLPNACATARAEGTELWTFPLKDPGGNFLGVALHLKDVSKSRETGEIFRQERDLLAQINDTSAVFCYEYDPPIPVSLPIKEQIQRLYHGVLAECNDVCARSYGAESAQQVIGKKLTELFGISAGSLDGLFTAMIEGEYRVKDGEGVEILADGSRRYYLNNGHGVIEQGKLVRIWGTFRDITERRQAEEVLRESEERLRMVGRAAYDLIYEWDSASDVLEWFGDVDGLLGYKNGKISRDINAWLDLIHPEDRNKLEDAVEHHRISTEPIQYVYRVRHQNGTYRYWNDHGLPLLDDKGCPYKWVGVCTDITERKRVEERLRLLSSAVEQSSEGIAVVDLEGNLLFVNRAFATMHGYTPEELVGKHLSIFHSPDQMPSVEAANRQIRETGEFSGEIWHIRRDGTEFPTLMHNSLLRDETGSPIGMIGTIRDITARKRAEEALRESEEVKRTLIDAIPDMMFVIDRAGRYLDYYPSRLDQPFVSPDEFIGKTGHDVLPRDVADDHLQCVRRALETGEPQTSEYSFDMPDGRKYYETRIVASGENTVLALARNVTDRKLADEALRKEREFNEKLIDASPTFFVAIDQNGKTLMMNHAMLASLGYTKDEVVGSDYLSTFVPKKDRRELAKVFAQLTKARTATRNENRILAKDGRTMLVEWHGQPVITPVGDLDFFFGVGIDVTERKRAEEERDRLFNLSIDMLSIIGFDGRFKQVNPAWMRILGWTEEELLSRTWMELIHPDEYDKSVAEAGKLVTGQAVFSLENRCRCKDGSYRWLSWNAFPLTEEGLIFSVTRDITERKQAEQALIFTQFSVDRAADAAFWMETDGRLIYVNAAACESLGYTRDELLTLSLADIDPDFQTEKMQDSLELLRDRGSLVLETHHRTKDGRLFPVEINSNHLRFEGREYICAFARDITIRQQAEIELRESEKRYRTLVDASPIPIMVYVGERFVFLNSAAVKALGGTTVGDFIGRSIWDVLQPDSVESGRSPGWWILEPKGSPGLIRENWVRLDGKSIDVELFAIEIDYRGESARQVVFNDVTERTATERKLMEYQQQLRALASEVTMTEERERQQIASNLHDGISQNLALAKMQLMNLHETTPSAQTSAPLMHTVELLEQALEHMRSLTFELSPPVLHRLGLEPAVIGLAEQMQEKYGLQIELEISEEATPLPNEVRVMLFRAVRELLINVIKHARTRRAKISMVKTDRRITIEVLDYGEGYDPVQTEPGRQRKEGFGLFSIRERLAYLGGSLNIDSQPGGGTRVVLTAPLAGEMAGKE